MNKPKFYHYVALLDYEADGVHVTFPDLPGCITFGDDEEKAVQAAREALALHLWGMEEDGEQPPMPSSIKHLADTSPLCGNEAFLPVDTFMPCKSLKKRNTGITMTC